MQRLTRLAERLVSNPKLRLLTLCPALPIAGGVALLVCICIVSASLRFDQIAGTLPYPRGVNEFILTQPALRILETGDFHPGRFRYPSFPTYLAATGMAIGFIRSAADSRVRSIKDIGDVYFPFYTVPKVVETARQLFALLSVLAIAACALAAFMMTNRPSALALAPLILALSPYYFEMSWRYLNVDIVGSCCIALGTAALLKGTCSRPSIRWLAVAPAICAGMAAGSKYTYGILLLPVLLAIWLYMDRGRRLQTMAIATVTTGATFLIVSPYTLLDLPAFLNGLAFEVRHYASGHPGQDGDRGIAKLTYYSAKLAKDFGVAGLLAAIIGLIAAARTDWRRTLVFCVFPLALLTLLATQRVEFARNVLPIFFHIAILIVIGLYAVHGWLGPRLARSRMSPRLKSPLGVAVAVGLFALAVYVPLGSIGDQLQISPESRHEAVQWISNHIPRNRTLIVPEELEMDTRKLARLGYAIRVEKFQRLDTAEAIRALVERTDPPAVVLVPVWRSDERFPDGEPAIKLNRAVDGASLNFLKRFGGRRLYVNYPRTISHGNPSFGIAVAEAMAPLE